MYHRWDPKDLIRNAAIGNGLNFKSAGTADLIIKSLESLSTARTLDITVNNANRSINLTGNLTLANNFITVGNFSLILTQTGTTNITLPTTGTLATLAGVETFTNKTINLTSNTLSGTTAQFNTALSDNDFATLAGTETLTNKTINASNNTISNLTTAMFAANVFDTDITLAANSATRIPAQSAVKGYVDNALTGVKWKQEVRAATTVNGTLATAYENGDTIDGVVLATNDRILIKSQTTQTENGIYFVNASGAPTRALDADTGAELIQAAVFVRQGTTNADTLWVCTNDAITLGSTNITFAQFGGASVYTAANGILLTGNQFTLDSPFTVTSGSVGLGTAPLTSRLTVAQNTSDLDLLQACFVSGVDTTKGLSLGYDEDDARCAIVARRTGVGRLPLLFQSGVTTIDCTSLALTQSAALPTFTPGIAFGGATTGITYTTQTGRYWQFGKLVWFWLQITLSSKGSATGDATITGLPVASAAGNEQFFMRPSLVAMNFGGGYLGAYATTQAASTIMGLRVWGDNVATAAITNADFSNTSQVNITGLYAA